jgi:hypothetical protein
MACAAHSAVRLCIAVGILIEADMASHVDFHAKSAMTGQ